MGIPHNKWCPWVSRYEEAIEVGGLHSTADGSDPGAGHK